MYPLIVRQMAFMGRGAGGAVVASSALCKSIDRSFSWQSSSWQVHVWLKLPGSNPLRSDIRAQDLRNHDGAVSLLIIFHDCDPRAADRQPAAVERVHELRFILAFRTEADVGTPCLIRLKIRTGRNLAIKLLPRQPDFDVVRLRRRGAHVARAERHRTIVQA